MGTDLRLLDMEGEGVSTEDEGLGSIDFMLHNQAFVWSQGTEA